VPMASALREQRADRGRVKATGPPRKRVKLGLRPGRCIPLQPNGKSAFYEFTRLAVALAKLVNELTPRPTNDD
jgi:hypothetical protein